VAFARRFGKVQVHVMSVDHADGFPELYRLSNLDGQGRPSGKHPDKGTSLGIPTARDSVSPARRPSSTTSRCRRRAARRTSVTWPGAYERLAAGWKRRIAGLRAVHNIDFSRTRRHAEDPLSEAQRRAKPPVDHPVLRVHPETGQRCLYLGDHAESIVGMPYDEGRALIEELNALAVAHADLRYEHRWQPHELIVWDNRSLLHRATAFDTERHARVVRRCTVLGEVPVGEVQERAAGP
jgi:alpha-ketoglutarate-dependent taurine dioxygenase